MSRLKKILENQKTIMKMLDFILQNQEKIDYTIRKGKEE